MKIYVACPGNSVTGGPEALHQLADSLLAQGIDASIIYYPFESEFKTPDVYKHYRVKTSKLSEVTKNDLVVIPETRTRLAKSVPTENIAIWWLSIDHYYGYPLSHPTFNQRFNHFFRILKGRKLSLSRMKHYIHLAQSDYASEHLSKNGLKSLKLTDYLGESHLTKSDQTLSRVNQIAFNPKKGLRFTSALRSNLPDLKFIPIENMTSTEVKELLAASKLYMDFGNHPGTDRLPREAAVAGCCIVTGLQGSAAFASDVAIPGRFKIDESQENFIESFKTVVDEVFSDFENVSGEFDHYRHSIRQGRETFFKEVLGFVEALGEVERVCG